MKRLPKGWGKFRLGDLAIINPRFVDQLPPDTQVSFVPMRDVEEATGNANPKESRALGEVRNAYTNFQDGDILFAKITPCMENGKIALAGNLINGLGFGSTEFFVFRPLAEIYGRYILHFLLQKSFRLEASLEMTGAVGQKRVPRKWLEDYQIPVPPLEEQKRIVAKVEDLIAELERGVAEAEAALRKCDLYVSNILEQAFTGVLSEPWRKKHQRIAESSSDLLSRILAERRNIWLEEHKRKSDVRKPKVSEEFSFVDLSTPSSHSGYVEPSSPKIEDLPPLPEGWVWASAEQLGFIQLGRQRSPKYVSKNYPTKYLRAANIGEAGVDLSDVLEMEFTPEERRTFKLRYGDILLSEASGSADRVGKPAIWRDELPLCCFQNTIIRLRPILVDPEYVHICLRYLYTTGYFGKLAGGIGINHLSAGKFSQVPLPLPPLEEQRQLIASVKASLEASTAAKGHASSAVQVAEETRENILSKAFAGALLPQIPLSEGASSLHIRLKQQKEAYLSEQQNRSKLMNTARKKTAAKSSAKPRTKVRETDQHPSLPESATLFETFPKIPTLTLKSFSIKGRYNSLNNLSLAFQGGSPLCLAGLNGSGKSNMIEALGEALCQTELEHVPFQSKKGVKSCHFEYQVNYAFSDGTSEFEVSLLRKLGKSATQVLVTKDGKSYAIQSAKTIFQHALPPRFIAYTSGLNETLSFPFLRNRSYYSEEVRTLADRKSKNAIAHRLNSLYMDRGLNSCILLALFIFKQPPQLVLFKEYLRIIDVTSFELIIRKKLPNGEVVRLTTELENTIDTLKGLATNSTESAKEHVFTYTLNASTKHSFIQKFQNGEKSFFLALYKLSLLNPLALGKPDRDFYKNAEFGDRLLVRPPDVSDANAIFFVRNMTLRIENPATHVPYSSISDGEHQFIQIFGTALLFDEPGNLFLFDEPESHFNPYWRARFVAILNSIPSTERQQFVLSTHSPYLLSGCYSKNVFKFKRLDDDVTVSSVANDFETFGASFEFILKQLFDLKVAISEEALETMKRALRSNDPGTVKEILGTLGESYERRFVIEHLMNLEGGVKK